MILDSSAIVAIFFAEPGSAELLDRLGQAARVAVGAPTLAETTSLLWCVRNSQRLWGSDQANASVSPGLGQSNATSLPVADNVT